MSTLCSRGEDGAAAGCDDGSVREPLALYAVLPLELRPTAAGTFSVPLRLQTVDTAVAIVDDEGALVGTGPGITTVLLRTDDGAVMDLFHLAVRTPTRLSLHRGSGADADERALPDAIEVFPDEVLDLRFRAFDGPQRLIGDLPDVWAVDNDAFQLVDRGFAEERTLRAPPSGQTRLTVSVGDGLSVSLLLSVKE